MKRMILALLSAALLATATPVAAASGPAMTPADLDAFFGGVVPYALQRSDVPGAVVVVVQDGRVVFAKGYGYADIEKRTPIDPDVTLFRPGSISKLFTWTAVMQLVQAHKIDLDADVSTYIDVPIPAAFGKPITMRDLMTHTPGFEETLRELIVDRADQVVPIRRYLVEHLPDRIFPPGEVTAYSNYGATLAGYIIQRVSGEKFEDYVARHILEPLHMTHATFMQPLPPQLAPLMATGYVGETKKPFEFLNTVPAGGLSASGVDMAHFMLAYLDGGTYDGYPLLRAATIAQMWTLQPPTPPDLSGFGLGWHVAHYDGLKIVGHGGDTEAFHSDLNLIPSEHVGIFVSFNGTGKAVGVAEVRSSLLRQFLDRYYPYAATVQAPIASAKADAARVAGFYLTSRRLERALRIYYALAQDEVRAHSDGTIEVASLKDPAGNPLRWREIGPLQYRQADGQARIDFEADANGNIVALNMGSAFEQRVRGLATLGALKLMLVLFIAVLVISLLVRLGAWIARRKLKLTLRLSRGEQIVHLLARIGAIAFLVALVGWPLLLGNENAVLASSVVGKLLALYAIGVVAVIGALAMIVEAAMRVLRGPGGWLVRAGDVVVGLAGLYGIWLFLAFGMVNFVTNF